MTTGPVGVTIRRRAANPDAVKSVALPDPDAEDAVKPVALPTLTRDIVAADDGVASAEPCISVPTI